MSCLLISTFRMKRWISKSESEGKDMAQRQSSPSCMKPSAPSLPSLTPHFPKNQFSVKQGLAEPWKHQTTYSLNTLSPLICKKTGLNQCVILEATSSC